MVHVPTGTDGMAGVLEDSLFTKGLLVKVQEGSRDGVVP